MAPFQRAPASKFLRLLNCRVALALIGIMAVLSFGGAGWAQTGDQPTASSSAEANDVRIRLACTNAPLETLVNYLSKAGGIAIHSDVPLFGRVTVATERPFSRAEATLVVEQILCDHGYVVAENNGALNITGLRKEIPVIRFSALGDIPASTEMVSCCMPCQTASPIEYAKVLTNLGLNIDLSGWDTNSLTITGVGMDVRCAAAAMLALDHSGDNEIKAIEIFPLKYADAVQMAAMVNETFAADRSAVARPPRAGSFVFGQHVFAKADSHSNSMVVNAPEDMMPIIRELVQKLDQPVEDITEVKLYHLKNADCTEMAKMLADLFPKPASAPTNNMGKVALVLAIPEPRTQSLIVSASKDLMPQIEDMINSLEAEPASPQARSNLLTQPFKRIDNFPNNGVETDGPSGGAKGF
jgi:type II secretory pathway component GspD/PulD (secretin)